MEINNILKIENMQEDKLLSFCLEASARYKHQTFLINGRNEDYEHAFRADIAEYCKDDLHFVYIRGIYNKFSLYYKECYEGEFPPPNYPTKFSHKYKSSHARIMELFNKHYTPIEENDLSYEEIEKFNQTIKTIIDDLELTEAGIRKKVKQQVRTSLSLTGLCNTKIDKVLTIFTTHLKASTNK